MTKWLHDVVESKRFQYSILGLIILAAIVVGLETYPSIAEKYHAPLHTLNAIILWIFALEAAMKMGQHGKHFYRYFKDPWNTFDFIIVVVCFLPFDAQYAAVLRLARIVRALRLVTAIPQLQLIVSALIKSIPSMFYVGVLLFLNFYVYAVLGVFLYRENDPVHFQDLPTAMLSLFRVITLEDWTDVMYIQMLGSDVYAYDNTTGIPTKPSAQPLTSAIYFVSFVFLGSMMMLNLFIGVILNSMEEAQEEQRKQTVEHQRMTGTLPTVGHEITVLEHQLDQMKKTIEMLRTRLGDNK